MLGIVVVNLSTAKGTSRAGEGYKQNATLGFVAVRSPRAARRLAATALFVPRDNDMLGARCTGCR